MAAVSNKRKKKILKIEIFETIVLKRENLMNKNCFSPDINCWLCKIRTNNSERMEFQENQTRIKGLKIYDDVLEEDDMLISE